MTTVNHAPDVPQRAVVCDDDPVVRRIVTAVLQRAGYARVEQTEFASEAVDLAEALQPQVVVLDLRLADESGLDVIPELRAASPNTRIIVYSGAEAMKVLARRAGAHVVLSKVGMASVSELEEAVTAMASS